jgi:uroporphyrinogen-III synthase
MRVLITRPEPDATRTAQSLRSRGHEVIVAPLLRTEAIAADVSGDFAAVLMTSANAARSIAAHPQFASLRSLPVLAVGDRTADAARQAGFAQVDSAAGALPDLVRLASRFAGRRLLYLAGEDRAGDLAAELARHRVTVDTAVIYRAVAAEALPAEAAQALAAGRIDAALHYSRRSAETLLRLAERAGLLNAVLSLAHYCLSDAVAVPLREAGAGQVLVATSPAEAQLLDLVPIQAV